MAESAEHMSYVGKIVSYIEALPFCCADLIEADLPNYNTRTTRVCGGYYPDVYYNDRSRMILGEAKTDNDILNSHTDAQIKAYIDELQLFSGERHIVLCCSIFSLATIRNYAIRLKRVTNISGITFHFIDSLNNTSKI
jgi:hypothetical protein